MGMKENLECTTGYVYQKHSTMVITVICHPVLWFKFIEGYDVSNSFGLYHILINQNMPFLLTMIELAFLYKWIGVSISCTFDKYSEFPNWSTMLWISRRAESLLRTLLTVWWKIWCSCSTSQSVSCICTALCPLFPAMPLHNDIFTTIVTYDWLLYISSFIVILCIYHSPLISWLVLPHSFNEWRLSYSAVLKIYHFIWCLLVIFGSHGVVLCKIVF